MIKFLVCTSVALLLTACATTGTDEDNEKKVAKEDKLAVVQTGAGQNAELVFCTEADCPQRTPKYLPKPAEQPKKKIVSEPRATQEAKNLLYKVHFRWGWSQLDEEGRKEIDEIIKSGALKKAKKIEVSGRTDPTGSLKANQKLALRRAETFKSLLILAGLPSENISATAQKPCCDGDLRADKKVMQELRRTDIDIAIKEK